MKESIGRRFGVSIIIALIGVALTFSSCKAKKSTTITTLNSKYLISKIVTPKFNDSFESQDYYVYFNSQGNVQAYIGCNNIGGSFQQRETEIEIGPLMSTKMYCRNMAAQEMALLNALEGSRSYSIQNETLILKGEGTELTLRKFKE